MSRANRTGGGRAQGYTPSEARSALEDAEKRLTPPVRVMRVTPLETIHVDLSFGVFHDDEFPSIAAAYAEVRKFFPDRVGLVLEGADPTAMVVLDSNIPQKAAQP